MLKPSSVRSLKQKGEKRFASVTLSALKKFSAAEELRLDGFLVTNEYAQTAVLDSCVTMESSRCLDNGLFMRDGGWGHEGSLNTLTKKRWTKEGTASFNKGPFTSKGPSLNVTLPSFVHFLSKCCASQSHLQEACRKGATAQAAPSWAASFHTGELGSFGKDSCVYDF